MGWNEGRTLAAGCFDQCLAIVLGLGIGMAISVAGNCGVNFSACYSCHSREKLRRCFIPAHSSVLVYIYEGSSAMWMGPVLPMTVSNRALCIFFFANFEG